MRSEPSMFPNDATGLAMWVVAGLIFGFLFSGCGGGVSDRETLRAHRADVVLAVAEGAVEDAAPLSILVQDEEAREKVEAARAAAVPSIRAARNAIAAYIDGQADGWQGAVACAAATLGDLIDALRASGVSSVFPEWLGDALAVLDAGAGYVGGGCS